MYKVTNRWQAFSAHFSISLVIFLAIFLVIRFYWFPGVFVDFGGWQGIRLVIGVDLVLGPLLTLIVFNPAKKSLKWDLLLIALLQIAGLAYGLWAIESQRVVGQILLDDKLFVLNKADYGEAGVSLEEVREIGKAVPIFAFINLPEDRRTIATSVVTSSLVGPGLHFEISRYIPVSDSVVDEVILSRLKWRLDRLAYDEERNCYWVEVKSSQYDGKACLDVQKGAIELERQ